MEEAKTANNTEITLGTAAHDGDNLEVGGLTSVPAAEEVAADAAETVDGDLHLSLGDGVDDGSLDGLDALEAGGLAAELSLEGRGGGSESSHF